MRRWLLWLAIRAVVFAGVNALLVHDFETCASFWAAFSILDLGNVMDARERNQIKMVDLTERDR